MSKMGTLEKLMSLLPGMSSMSDKVDYEATQQRLGVFKVIMDSMTKEEKDDPALIKSKRIDRIAAGAGVTSHDVKELLKQYTNSKKMMTSVTKDRKMRKQLMKQMGGVDMDALKDLQGSE